MSQKGTTKQAVDNARELLNDNLPDLAIQQLQEVLATDANEVNALRLMGVIHLSRDEIQKAIEFLEKATGKAPDFHLARLDLATAYRKNGDLPRAARVLRKLTRQQPGFSKAWQLFADLLTEQGKFDAAREAFEQAIAMDLHREEMKQAMEHLFNDRRDEAESLFRSILEKDRMHLHALIGLASIALDARLAEDAEQLLRLALSLAPHLDRIWIGLARASFQQGHPRDAEFCGRQAVLYGPKNPESWGILATMLAWVMKSEEAAAAFKKSLALEPTQAQLEIALGHVLKSLGESGEAVAAYHRAIALNPLSGEAYWSLADMKSYRFTESESSEMNRILYLTQLPEPDRAAFNFALGWAEEARGDFSASFRHYQSGNAIKHRLDPFDRDLFKEKTRATKALFSDRRLLAEAAPINEEDPVPIFIVGLPRSGSTLVEQILASHSQIQATMELPHILNYAAALNSISGEGVTYPESIAGMDQSARQHLGQTYLQETTIYRGNSHFFVDKMPNNFFHIGLIHLILPQAIIVDVRRNPMDCCLSLYKQNFASMQNFSYRLEDLVFYCNEYVQLMKFWDQVLPGKVLRIDYESLVEEPESQIRRLLDHCGVEFEPACLHFHETKRSIRTASAEQVRQPMYDDRINYWRNYEQFLRPLQAALDSDH